MLKPDMIVSGDTWRRAWILQDANGAPINLTGATARLHLRNSAGGLVASASTADGRIVIDAEAGRVDMTVPASVTVLPAGGYRFALELTGADGTVQTVETNTLAIREDVTHGDE